MLITDVMAVVNYCLRAAPYEREDYGTKSGINEKGGKHQFRKTFATGSDRKKEYRLLCTSSVTKNSSIMLPRISFTANENLVFFLVVTM